MLNTVNKNPLCPYCGSDTIWMTKDRLQEYQMKFEDSQGRWHRDGFICSVLPYCKGLHNDEAIYLQRKNYIDKIVDDNIETSKRLGLLYDEKDVDVRYS